MLCSMCFIAKHNVTHKIQLHCDCTWIKDTVTLLCKYIANVQNDEEWNKFKNILQNDEILNENNEISTAALYSQNLQHTIGLNAKQSNFSFIQQICQNEELIKSKSILQIKNT